MFLFAFNAKAEVTIFACEPEWANLAQRIVQDKARVKVAIAPNQNPKKVDINSARAAKMREANLVFCNGGNLEEKWLPELIKSSGNTQIITDKQRVLFAYDYSNISAIKKANAASEARTTKAPNRVHLNPYNVKKVAAEFVKRIKFIDEANADFYQKTYENFDKKWEEAIKIWEEKAAPLKGMVLVANDDSWSYLAEWLGLEIITLTNSESDEKPNSSDYYRVSELLRTIPAEAVIFGRFEDKKILLQLRERNKMKMIFLPFTVGGGANSSDIFWLFETTIKNLLAGCSGISCKGLNS